MSIEQRAYICAFKSDYGFWTLTKVDAAIWDVTIKGKSPLYIKQNFYEKGSSSPIFAAPVIGNEYFFIYLHVCKISVVNSFLGNVDKQN